MAGEQRSITGHFNGRAGVHTELDLFNFDAPEHQKSRYILTSPRSLRACGRLGIKPVELLPKTLDEFAATSSELGLQQDTLTAVYQEYERQRRAKLQAARRERERVIAEQRDSKPSNSESGYGPPSCPVQAWGDKLGRKKGGRVVTFEDLPEDWKRKKTAYTPVAHLPEKDQRIVHAMIHHWSEEEQQAAMREEEAWRWHLQQREEEGERRERQLRHQRELNQSKQRFQKQLAQLQSVRQSMAAKEEAEKLANLQAKWERWDHAADLQATSQAQRRAERKLREDRRKEEQEWQLRDLQEEGELERAATKEYLGQLETQAYTNKESISHTEAMKRQMRKEREKNRYERKKAEVEAQNQDDQEVMRATVEGKHALARERYRTQLSLREAGIRHSVDARNRRAVQRKLAAERIEEELNDWRREVDAYNRVSMLRAEELSRRLLAERSQKTHSWRTERQKEHSEKLKKVMEEEDERLQQTAMEVKLKREKIEGILRERENAIQKARVIAHESMKVRGQIKEHYMRNSFDRLAHEAEMYASLCRTPRTSTKNISKVILG